MTEPRALDSNLHNRVTRYIHTGTEIPKYFPGCWNSHKYFEVDKLQALNEVIVKGEDMLEVVNIILKVNIVKYTSNLLLLCTYFIL